MGSNQIFTIKKGRHSSSHGFHLYLFKKELNFSVMMVPDCLYRDEQIPGQINKVFGISFGVHSSRSVRIGWRGHREKIEFNTYVHLPDGQVKVDPLGPVQAGKVAFFRIWREGKIVSVEMQGGARWDYTFDRLPFWGYRLYPYFGGIMPAPQEMKITISF